MEELLKESRDLLLLCTFLDKSGQCNEMVDKIDAFMKEKIVLPKVDPSKIKKGVEGR